MRRVRHPHVVALLNYHESGLQAHLVMELLPGGDLYSQVVQRYCGDRATGYSESDVREILRMALSGLEALHNLGIVHRDVKPENLLLLDRRGGLLDLRIADLGTARQLSTTERCTTRAGTPGYMAPEVLLELLVHAWVHPMAAEHSPSGARAAGKCGTVLARRGSLPGSKSLLELQGYQKSARRRRASGDQCEGAAMWLSGPPSAPSKAPKWSMGSLEVDKTPSTRDWRLLFSGVGPRVHKK